MSWQARVRWIGGVMLAAAALASAPAVAKEAGGGGSPGLRTLAGMPALTPDEVIRGIIHSPTVARRISAWGLSVEDVQHDVDVMTPAERARLVMVLLRPWPASTGYAAADYQAQYLVTISLMRTSALFASVVSSGLRIR